MFKEFFSGVQEKYKKMQEEDAKYRELLEKATVLPAFYSLPEIDKKKITISPKLLLDLCPDLNEQNAFIIRGVIPVDEVCLHCLYATECKTGVKFYFVATTKYLWLIHSKGYLKYQYDGFVPTLIKSSFMSQTFWMGNMLFTINGVQDNIQPFIMLLQDSNYRVEKIKKELEIFCNTIPRIFYLNSLSSGISIGVNNEIVFHTKNFHYKYFIQDIVNYELLLDDMIVREKKSHRKTSLTANKNGCYEMVLRVTTKDQQFILPIIEKTAFMTMYASTTEVFRQGRGFADTIINVLDDLDEKMLNGTL